MNGVRTIASSTSAVSQERYILGDYIFWIYILEGVHWSLFLQVFFLWGCNQFLVVNANLNINAVKEFCATLISCHVNYAYFHGVFTQAST